MKSISILKSDMSERMAFPACSAFSLLAVPVFYEPVSPSVEGIVNAQRRIGLKKDLYDHKMLLPG
jgi:hypothetical protein